jgi:anion-transporting  ArsA/GET3 family ATPase
MLPAPVPLFDHEMLFVTGKGGVGKTTVAAALGVASQRTGRRTIVCELSGQARIPSLFGAQPAEPGDELHLEGDLWATTIAPYRVMEEWIGRILMSRALTGLLTHSNFFRAFADAAPGGMELGSIVKTWELTQAQRWDRKQHGYDLVIVDGPATGHAVGMLRTPGTFADIARVGPIATQSQRVREWLGDAHRTGFLAVALPEELPVAETLDLGARLDRAIGRRLDAVVVNAVLPDRFSAAELDEVEDAAPEPWLAEAVRAADGRADAQHEQLARLRAASEAPVSELPFVFAPALGREDVEDFADLLAVA